jgi:PTS system D-glucosamine-specific IIC component/PTS system maltose and glucose-specific IIC component
MKAFFSKLSQALMLPIALLPAAGIMLGIGGSFTNQAMVEAYGLTWLAEGTFLNSILIILREAGGIVFATLPILFAVGLAVGFAKKEKGAAALSALISYLVMNVVIATLLGILDYTVWGKDIMEVAGATTTVLGIENTLNMGVFGGIIAGFITAMLHNKYIDMKLPDVLGFFGGPRLIPIVSSFAALVYGAAFVFIWPPIGEFLSGMGAAIASLGPIGSLLFGLIERALIPFGLHHVFYLPLWQTPVGGCIEAGQICGTQNQFFYLLENGRLEEFTSTNFMSGKFPFMIFGLPGAAYAMYKTALPENKKVVGGMLFSVAFTAMLTGITEPIEFTFLFLAPWLYYGVHVPLAGLSFMLMDLLNVKIGMTFSGGLIDYALFGLLPQLTGQDVNAFMVILLGIPFFFIYYFILNFAILIFNILTPGRGGDLSLKTKADFKAKQEGQKTEDNANENILGMIEALGGADNIVDVDACITRLRVTVKDNSLVKDNEYWVNELGAKGLVVQGNGIQAIYGSEAKYHKSAICDVLGIE